jgi:hypothetical protein
VTTEVVVGIAGALVSFLIGAVIYFFARRITSLQIGGFELQIEKAARALPEGELAVTEGLSQDRARQLQQLEQFQQLVSEYHRQALSQAKIQFWFSVAAAVFGLGLVSYAVISSLNATELELISRVAPGLAVEAVSGLFFSQAKETRDRATALYKDLTQFYTDIVQQSRQFDAINIIKDTIHPNHVALRDVLLAQLGLHIAGIEVPPPNLESLARSTYGLPMQDTSQEQNTGK